MRILAIETSCDETAISIVEASGSLDQPVFSVLAHQVSSQIKLHTPYGGVVPMLAKREHANNIVAVLIETLKQAGFYKSLNIPLVYDSEKLTQTVTREPELLHHITTDFLTVDIPPIDLIAVTTGPGLEPALWVGINFAKVLGLLWDKNIIGVNHMAGHIVSPLLIPNTKVIFPALALLISGGHTELVLVARDWQYQKIGQTRDDAVGEAFDKVARLLDLPYPGGPQISILADKADKKNTETNTWKFPRPMLHSDDFDFSFSGIKTSVLYAIKKHGELAETDKIAVAREFQDAVIEVLVQKTSKAIEQHDIKTLIIGGGVISNIALRSAFQNLIAQSHPEVTLLIPEFAHTTDNATMIAAAAYITQFSTEPSKNPELIARGNASL